MSGPQRQPYPRKFTAHEIRIINGVTDGDQVTDKDYVDGAIAAAVGDLIDKGTVDAATTAALPANTRTGNVLKADAVGAFPTIDGVAAAPNNEYLVKNEGGGASHINNGIYILTVVGDGATEWELTRRSDLTGGDSAAGAFVHVEQGTANADSTFRCINNVGTDVVNTDALEWVYWGQTVDHQYLKNRAWSVAGHTIDTNIDMNSNGLTELGLLQATAGQDLTVKLGDAAGAKKLTVTDSGDVEVFSVNSDGVVTVKDPGTSEAGTITRTGTDLEIDSGTGGDLKLIAAGSQALWINPGYSVFTTGLVYMYDATTTYGALFETNATHTIWRAFTSALDMKIMWGDKDALLINNDASGGIFPDVVLASSSAMIPAADSCCTLGITIRYFDTLFVDKLELGDDELIQVKESLGIARALNLNIPIGAGGASGAALDMQMQLDGTMEAGLLAETDGAGGYQEPVFKIPAYSADYGVAWASPPNPTPASLTNGSLFVAENTNDSTYRLYAYLNSAWKSVEMAAHTLLHATNHQNGGSDEISVAGLSGQLADDQPTMAHDLGGAKHNADTKANLITKISDVTEIITNNSGEINGFAEKTAPIAADLMLIEDSAATNAKKKVQLSNLPSRTVEKAGVVAGGSFAGNPKKYTVTFNTAMPDNNYAITVLGEDSRNWTIESKAAGSFVINSGSNVTLVNNVFWTATINNDP